MLEVTTKQIIKDGKWNCSCTYECYDHLEVGETIEEAQSKIANKLRKWGYEGGICFKEPIPYKSEPIIGQSAPPVSYRPWRIDRGIV